MNFVIAATVFPIVFLGELPDKTMFASLVMSTRGSPLAVWLGTASAFAVHVVIAVTIGTAAVAVLPHRALNALVAVLFLGGALLVLWEMRHSDSGEPDGQGEDGEPSPRRPVQVGLASFAVVFVAEWGDLTQILTANLTAHYHAPLPVGVGALVALWSTATIAVTGGRWLSRVIDVRVIRVVTIVVLTGFAVYAAWIAIM